MEYTDESGWIVENFYFGNAVWPSDRTWQHRGLTYQVYFESWTLYRTLEEAETWASMYHDVVDTVIEKDDSNPEYPYRAAVWRELPDGQAMKAYLSDKEARWK